MSIKRSVASLCFRLLVLRHKSDQMEAQRGRARGTLRQKALETQDRPTG
jgi:hypothetical protein